MNISKKCTLRTYDKINSTEEMRVPCNLSEITYHSVQYAVIKNTKGRGGMGKLGSARTLTREVPVDLPTGHVLR